MKPEIVRGRIKQMLRDEMIEEVGQNSYRACSPFIFKTRLESAGTFTYIFANLVDIWGDIVFFVVLPNDDLNDGIVGAQIEMEMIAAFTLRER